MIRLLPLILLGCIAHASEAEDLRSAEHWLRKNDKNIGSVRVAAKHAVDSTYSVLVVNAVAPPGSNGYIGVFIVYGKTNQVYMVLDIRRDQPLCCTPKVECFGKQFVYLHWFADYGFYRESWKYTYDLPDRRPASRSVYKRFSVEQSRARNRGLHFLSSESTLSFAVTERRWTVGPAEAPPRSPGTAPLAVRLALSRVAEPSLDRLVDAGSGRWLYLPPAELAGAAREQAGLYLVEPNGRARFYRAPKGNVIGPFMFDGRKLWFANDFYDGEGETGVGALGTFDVATRRFEMRYLPQMARWSASALNLEGEHLWVGLMRRPEGAPYGAGILRYQIQSGHTSLYSISDLVKTIDAAGETVYFGTDHGVYTLDRSLTHVRVEPGPTGSLETVKRTLIEGVE